MFDVGYRLRAIHALNREPIVAFAITEAEGKQIISRLWPGRRLWEAPGGCSWFITTEAEAEVISEILGDRWITFDPAKHQWLFDVYLIEPEDFETDTPRL
jgi:hypothetical protein